jgi:hypothetical protein
MIYNICTRVCVCVSMIDVYVRIRVCVCVCVCVYMCVYEERVDKMHSYSHTLAVYPYHLCSVVDYCSVCVNGGCHDPEPACTSVHRYGWAHTYTYAYTYAYTHIYEYAWIWMSTHTHTHTKHTHNVVCLCYMHTHTCGGPTSFCPTHEEAPLQAFLCSRKGCLPRLRVCGEVCGVVCGVVCVV